LGALPLLRELFSAARALRHCRAKFSALLQTAGTQRSAHAANAFVFTGAARRGRVACVSFFTRNSAKFVDTPGTEVY
jgi:hypothetical protein